MLQILLILFIILAVVSGLSIALLYLLKNPKAKNILFYFLASWSMLIAFFNATSLPNNYILEQLLAWGIGFIAVIAIIIKLVKPTKINISYLLVSASAVLGLLDLFFF